MESNLPISLSANLKSPLSTNLRSPYSPRSRQALNTSKRSSLLPGLKKTSRASLSGRSVQTVQTITKTPFHTVESFGSPLPVLINEALTFVERNTVLSAHISECGYAWVVCGRRLLIWQYKQLSLNTRNMAQCYELILPQSDLVHRADLACVILPDSNINSVSPSCLAVSPEGIVRYWPSLSHEGVYVEENIELQGQECDTVIHVANVGCILATTTCSIVLLLPTRRSIASRILKPPTGWLGGISRRISSLIFGPMSSSQVSETKLVKVSTAFEAGEWNIYLLAGHSLQKWSLSVQNNSNVPSEQLIYECDVGRLLRDVFHNALWEAGTSGDTSIDNEIWILDMQVSPSSETTLLVATVNFQRSPQIHYATACIYTGSSDPPTSLRSFHLINVKGLYRQDAEAEVFGYRLLICGNYYYLYNQRSIIALGNVNQTMDEPDVIEFSHTPSDCVLGGSVCINTPLFFSKNNGLVTVINNNDLNVQDHLNSSLAASDGLTTPSHGITDISLCESNAGNLTLYNLDPYELLTVQTDLVGQLKAAFIHYVKKNITACDEILSETFSTSANEIDAPLDKCVVSVSRELINDIPDGDPRWVGQKAQKAGLGSSTSMQIIRQLQDKMRALDLFITFLKDTKLWPRLSKISTGSTITATTFVLAEHCEKIVAAITLRNIQSNHENLLKRAMELSLEDDGLQNTSDRKNLTTYDLFYRSVTRVHRIIQQLATICQDQTHSELDPLQLANLIHETNTIVLTILQEVINYRQKNVEIFTNMKSNQCEYLPWTATMGNRGVRDSLHILQNLTLKEGIQVVTADINLINSLYEQLISLIDLILDGKKCHLESVRGTDKFNVLLQEYETERHNLIKTIYDNKQYERASMLAEKYCYFSMLVMICEVTNNQAKLDEYMERFASYNFCEYVFNWYLRENKPNRLIIRGHKGASSKSNETLSKLVSDYPSLAWIQQIFRSEYVDASKVLHNLACNETEYVTRKKSMLSLAKLAQLASPTVDEDVISNINSDLNLIAHQEDIPDMIMSEHGYNVENPRVLTPVELILLYIDLDNSIITELDFKKALDLLAYIDDDIERSELSHKIWCAAIQKDLQLWQKLVLDPVVQTAIETTFFKIIDVAVLMGCKVDEFMPPLDRLLEAPELSPLNTDKNFQYLMKSGYEHVYRTYKDVSFEI